VSAFGDGVRVVGGEITPGRDQAAGSGNCYWGRLSGFGGTLGEIITNDLLSAGPVVVDIVSTDAGFQSNGCGTFTRIG
jgi:hypothetical protein